MATLLRSSKKTDYEPLLVGGSVPTLPDAEQLELMRGRYGHDSAKLGSTYKAHTPSTAASNQVFTDSPTALHAPSRHAGDAQLAEAQSPATDASEHEHSALLLSDGLSHDQQVRNPLFVSLVVPQYPAVPSPGESANRHGLSIELAALPQYPTVAPTAAQQGTATADCTGVHIGMRTSQSVRAASAGSDRVSARTSEAAAPAAVRSLIGGAGRVVDPDDEVPLLRQAVALLRGFGIDMTAVATGCVSPSLVASNPRWQELRSAILGSREATGTGRTKSLLALAAGRKQPGMLRLLLRLAGDLAEHRARRRHSGTDGPLAAAVAANSPECVRILLASGASDPNEVSGKGVTSALMAGMEATASDGVDALLEARRSIRGLAGSGEGTSGEGTSGEGTSGPVVPHASSTPPGVASAPPAEDFFFMYDGCSTAWGNQHDASVVLGTPLAVTSSQRAGRFAASGQTHDDDQEEELDLDWEDPLNGDTAMHVAARSGWAEMVALLAWYGAGVTPRNGLGQTPRQAATITMSKYAKVVEVLEDLEASGVEYRDERSGRSKVVGSVAHLRGLGRRYGFGWRHRGRPAGRVRALVLWKGAAAARGHSLVAGDGDGECR